MKISSLELAINLIPVFTLFLVGAYLSYRLINQRKNYANATGIMCASVLLSLFSLVILFTYFPFVSYLVKIQENPNYFYKNTSLVLTAGVLLIALLSIYICNLREKNNTTIVLYGIKPTSKTEFIKKALEEYNQNIQLEASDQLKKQ